MTDVQPNPDREEDLETTTPQPDENPQQREHLREKAQRQPGQEDPAPASGGEGAAGAGGPNGFGTGG
jgi:hypothetical protein